MSSSLLHLHQFIQPLHSCLNEVIDISQRGVINELVFMQDQRVRYIQPDSTKYLSIMDIDIYIRYASDLYYLCECLFFQERQIKMSTKKIYSVIHDKRNRFEGELFITDSLIVELIWKVDELCTTFLVWLNERFGISIYTMDEKLLSIVGIDIDSSECESILSSVKFTIGLINLLSKLKKEKIEGFSFDTLVTSVPQITEIFDCLFSYLVSFRVLGCWVCSMGLFKNQRNNIDTRLKVCTYLASALAIIDDASSNEANVMKLISELTNSIRADVSVFYAEYLISIANYSDAYKFLQKAKLLKWKDKEKLLEVCTKELKERIPEDGDTNVTKKPLSDAKILLKGKEPIKYAEFKLLQ